MQRFITFTIGVSLLLSSSLALSKGKEKDVLSEAAKERGISEEDTELFRKLLLKIADGCGYLWPHSEKLQQKCVKTELNNAVELIREIRVMDLNSPSKSK